MDDDGLSEDKDDHDNSDGTQNSSFKCFHLLNALSDLLMLPKDMLLNSSIRKEVHMNLDFPLSSFFFFVLILSFIYLVTS